MKSKQVLQIVAAELKIGDEVQSHTGPNRKVISIVERGYQLTVHYRAKGKPTESATYNRSTGLIIERKVTQ